MSKILDWRGRGLKLDTRADFEPLIKDVDPATVEEIHLGGNTLGVEAAQALGEFLQKANHLKVADFADIFTGRLITEIPPALVSICSALKDKTSLVELDLSDNAFGGRSVDPIVPFLVENRSFQILKLNNNGLGPAGGSVIAQALLDSANASKHEGKPSNLRVIICGRNRLENGSASLWGQAFAAHGSLEQVRMPQNGIRMAGITAIANGLAKNASIEYIDLQDNCFLEEGDLAGLTAWNDALTKWENLTFLNLSDCVLSEEGEIPILLTSLANGSNKKLHTLQLQNNNLDSASYELLASAIETGAGLETLMSLDLEDNDGLEDDEHIATLSKALKKRGGKLAVGDDDESEAEEEVEKEPTLVDQAADALADLVSKISIK